MLYPTVLGIQNPMSFGAGLNFNKIIQCAMVYLLGNNISNMISQSGAFEIFVDKKLVISKLATGDLPTEKQIRDKLMEEGVALK